MRKVLLVHISSSGCCNTLVTMLNNGDFSAFHTVLLQRFPPLQSGATFSTPAVWCRVFQSRVFSRPFATSAHVVSCSLQLHYMYRYLNL